MATETNQSEILRVELIKWGKERKRDNVQGELDTLPSLWNIGEVFSVKWSTGKIIFKWLFMKQFMWQTIILIIFVTYNCRTITMFLNIGCNLNESSLY